MALERRTEMPVGIQAATGVARYSNRSITDFGVLVEACTARCR